MKRTSNISVPQVAKIPEGEFLMGCAEGRDDEQPVHQVTVDSFEMGIYTTTNQEYRIFLGETDGAFPPLLNDPLFNHSRQPVVSVSWEDAVSYCTWLTVLTEKKYRLPTEAEWEWASRQMKNEKLYPWGNDDPSLVEIYRDGWRDNRPQVVGQQSANLFGLFNVGDNVHEWCADWYAKDYYQRSPKQNPFNSTPTERKSSRGGSWRHKVKVSRCAARSSLHPSFRYPDYGFRVVRELS
jgi:formylglycine-generating enzyme required for sulfatase activity